MIPLSNLVLLMKNGTTADQNQEGRGLPTTRIETISDGTIDTKRVRYVELAEADVERWKLQHGDILLSHINSVEHIGKSAIYQGQPETLIHGMNLLLLRPDQKVVLPEYLHFGLRSNRVRETVRSRCKRAINQASINQKELGAIELPVPSLEEQRRIVDLLSRAEGIVRLRREAEKKAAELIPALFLDMFGDPGTNPKGWEVNLFGNLCINKDGQRKPIKSSDRATRQGKYPYYGASGIIDSFDDFLFQGEHLLIAEDGANLLSRSTPIAFIATGQYWVNNHAHVVADNGKANLTFLECWLNLRDLKDFITGSAQPKLTQANLNGLPVMCPPLALQQNYCEKVVAVRSILNQQTGASIKAQATFDALLAQAFSN